MMTGKKNWEVLGSLDLICKQTRPNALVATREASLGWVSAAPGRSWALRPCFTAVLKGLVETV